MIYNDDIKVAVDKKFAMNFTKPVEYELHPSQVGWSHDKKAPSYPSARGLMAVYTISENGKSTEVRYVENTFTRKIAGRPETTYSPEHIFFTNRGRILLDPKNPNDVDLHFFLSQSPRNPASKYFDSSKTPLFVLVDNAAKAADQTKMDKYRVKAENSILFEWNEFQLKEILYSFDIPVAEDITLDELQVLTKDVMNRNITLFVDRCADENLSLKAEIAQGVDLNILSYDKDERTWSWGEKTSKAGERICVVKAEDDIKHKLVETWKRTAEKENIQFFRERLKDILEEKASKAGKKFVKKAVQEVFAVPVVLNI